MPKSRFVFALETILIIVMIGGYNGDVDLVYYRLRYKSQTTTEQLSERLYNDLAKLFSSAGVSFENFHLLVSAVSIILIAYVVIKTTKRPALVMASLVGFATVEYGIQIQALCAAGVVVISIYYLFRDDNISRRKKILWYTIGIIIACGFHFVSLFFLSFLLIPYVKSKYIKYWITGGVISVCILFPMFKLLSENYAYTLSDYIGNYRSPLLIAVMCLWHLTGVYLITRMKKYSEKMGTYDKISDCIYKGSFVVCLIMPFYSLTVVASRIVRIWFVYYMIFMGNLPTTKGRVSVGEVGMIGYNIGSLVLFYIAMSWNSSIHVLEEILTYNIFWP